MAMPHNEPGLPNDPITSAQFLRHDPLHTTNLPYPSDTQHSSTYPPLAYRQTITNPTLVLHKDRHIYFQDGSVVLVAGTICFRVHQSLLAKHCSIFRDMLDIPHPQDQETYEGVPRVDLQDDPAIVRAFLRVIYEPLSSPLKAWLTQSSLQSTAEMVGVLSFALKYEADALRDEIIHQLSSSWPRTLEDWDTTEKKREMFGNTPRFDPAAAIRMARVADLPDVLPLAYYSTIQTYPKRTGDNVGNEGEKGNADETQAMTDLLDRQDLAALASGREEMAKWVARYARSEFRTWICHSGTSQRGFVCSQRIHMRWAEVLEEVTMRRDILEVLKEHASWGTGTFGNILCSPCQSAYVEIMRQMRKDFFRDLPKIFALGPFRRRNGE